jgi:ketosteroid isomerase-like protein
MRAEDQLEIAQLAHRYARGMDQRDLGALKALFTEDLTVAADGMRTLTGRDRILRGLLALVEPCDLTIHSVTTTVVEPGADDDSARLVWYVQARHTRFGVPGGDTFTVSGTYTETVTRCDGDWVIAARQFDIVSGDGNADVLPGFPVPAKGGA